MTDDPDERGVSDDPDDPDEALPAAVRASNWKTVLAVDALLGFGGLVLGLVLMVLWNVIVGAFVASGALVYVLLVGRRALQWRWLRREAGL